jgi:hypothetical protein
VRRRPDGRLALRAWEAISVRRVGLAVAFLVILAAGPASGADPVAHCAAAQLSATAKLCYSLFKCESRSIARPEWSATSCEQKARDRFARAWEKSITKARAAESSCELESSANAATDDLVQSVGPIGLGILGGAELATKRDRRLHAKLLRHAGSMCRAVLKAESKNLKKPNPAAHRRARARASIRFQKRAQKEIAKLAAAGVLYVGRSVPEVSKALLALPLVVDVPTPPEPAEPPVNFTIAFIGDQGLGANARAVLALIESEGADAVLHQGDFDYRDDPAAWEAQIDAVLGPDFPYFASAGNHDTVAFDVPGGYQDRLEARMNRLGIPWSGDLGVQSTLHYRGIFVVLTAPAVFGRGDGWHDLFIRDALAADDSIWSISSWHKNMTDMQVGGKTNETGWGVYEESRRGGAIIATAHEHSYSRTHLMASFADLVVASTDEPLVLSADAPETSADEGRSFAFVSGLGGHSIRDQERDGAWWASVYTSNQGARPGALFGVLNYEGDPRLAFFYFKDIDGNIVDEFTVESVLGNGPMP